MSINWGQVYSGPIGQILTDLNPQVFTQMATQESQTQLQSLNSRASADQTQINAWTTLQSDAQSFNSALQTLGDSATYNQLQTTSSSSNVASAADSSAQAGQYTISVQSVAQSEIDMGSAANLAVTDPTATLTQSGSPLTGAFSISTGGSTVNVTLPSGGTSLNGLASLINSNAASAKVGITATVVQNGQGQYVLEVQGNQTDAPITYANVTGSPLYALGLVSSSGTGTQNAANVLQSATPAEVSFGSQFNAANAVTSKSNTFSDLIPGLTVTVSAPGTTTLSVTPNVSAMANNVQSFVSAWNQWVSDTQSLAESGQVVSSGSGASQSFSYQTNANQVLKSGIPTSVMNQVQGVLASYTTNSSSAYSSLADLGLSFDASGKLSINSQTLTAALQTNPSAVQAVFSGLESALQPSAGTGVLTGFSLGPTSTSGEAIATLTAQNSSIQNQVTLLNQNTTAEEQRAIVQYGQWVNQVAKYSQQYQLLNAIYNQNSSNSTTGG